MKITASITKDFAVKVEFTNAPASAARLGIMYYAIIRAMKKHCNNAFHFAMDKFIAEEIDEMMGDKEDD